MSFFLSELCYCKYMIYCGSSSSESRLLFFRFHLLISIFYFRLDYCSIQPAHSCRYCYSTITFKYVFFHSIGILCFSIHLWKSLCKCPKSLGFPHFISYKGMVLYHFLGSYIGFSLSLSLFLQAILYIACFSIFFVFKFLPFFR